MPGSSQQQPREPGHGQPPFAGQAGPGQPPAPNQQQVPSQQQAQGQTYGEVPSQQAYGEQHAAGGQDPNATGRETREELHGVVAEAREQLDAAVRVVAEMRESADSFSQRLNSMVHRLDELDNRIDTMSWAIAQPAQQWAPPAAPVGGAPAGYVQAPPPPPADAYAPPQADPYAPPPADAYAPPARPESSVPAPVGAGQYLAPEEVEPQVTTSTLSLTVSSLSNLTVVSVVEAALLRIPGVREVALRQLQGREAVLEVRIDEGTGLISGLRKSLPIAFDVTESSEQSLGISLSYAEPQTQAEATNGGTAGTPLT